ncbi:Retrovirus-related Pol polyprotein from transposon TNT 1-94 [Gossypium australe]|uniref:Retrovirus-related Pol polyprotein from transposon TNT 1-94 n=1 Tax=Gossypium australe TaxID=47621 RepID=A0A5B6WNZ5_9ROSI|nr:Retrovirus-related Pol polyprotein from transposon TNT 1-94 [Gossypium australe]
MPSDGSAHVEPQVSSFTGDRLVYSFPRHDVVKLNANTFVQKQIRLIVAGYDLTGFLNGSLASPTRFVLAPDGALVSNPDASAFLQQVNLLTSWLLSTISPAYLASFTDVQTASDVWSTASSLFAADTGLCALLHAFGSPVPEAERTEILLAGLPSEFEAVVSTVNLSLTTLPLQCIVDALLECDRRQQREVRDELLVANLVENSPTSSVVESTRGGRFSMHGRGRGFRQHLQCHICARYGHISQRYFYHYHHDDNAPMVDPPGGSVAGGSLVPSPYMPNAPNFKRDEYPSSRMRFSPSANPQSFGQNMASNGQNMAYNGPTCSDRHCILASSHYFGQNWDYKGQNYNVNFDHQFASHGRRQQDQANLGVTPGPHAHGIGVQHGPHAHVNFGGSYGRAFDEPKRMHFQEPNDLFGQGRSTPIQPINNCVQVGVPLGRSQPVDLFRGEGVPWKTKSRARVYSGSDPCIGLPLLGDLHASDYSDSSGSHINAAQIGSTDGGKDSYIPMLDESTSWYPDSGASNHVCRDTSALNDVTPYLVCSSLVAASAALQNKSNKGDVFSLWHKCLGHPTAIIVKTVLDKCNIVSQTNSLENICTACQKGRSRKLSFSLFTIEYSNPFDLVVSDLWGPASVACENYWYYIEFVDGYAFCCAVHLINRLPMSVLKGLTPYRALYGTDPSMIISSPQHKGYQCLLPDGKVIVSRHVVFDENSFLNSEPAEKGTIVDHTRSVSTYVPLVRVCPVAPSVASPYVSVSRSQHPESSSGFSIFKARPEIKSAPKPTRNESGSSECHPTNEVSPGIQELVIPASNGHPMVTRSKAGIFKPKALTTEVVEPFTIEEAFSSLEWRDAAQAEYNALIRNNTWDLVSLPSNRKIIGCKWLFKLKRNPDGLITRRKAWLVAKGCSQIPGCDFKETFSPVVKPATIQAPRAWFEKLKKFLISIGFVGSKSNASLFIRIQSESVLYVLVYVDDIIITGSLTTTIDCYSSFQCERRALRLDTRRTVGRHGGYLRGPPRRLIP